MPEEPAHYLELRRQLDEYVNDPKSLVARNVMIPNMEHGLPIILEEAGIAYENVVYENDKVEEGMPDAPMFINLPLDTSHEARESLISKLSEAGVKDVIVGIKTADGGPAGDPPDA